MKFFVATISLLSLISGAQFQDPEPTCVKPNERYFDCGNLCEDSCTNTCDPSVFLGFGQRRPDTNPACIPGCYCDLGYIRNADNKCVLNVPGVCAKNRCAGISRNAVYIRCTAGAPEACFDRGGLMYLSGGVTGRCMCAPGYSMSSLSRCVKSTSSRCIAEKTKLIRLSHLPPAPDCV